MTAKRIAVSIEAADEEGVRDRRRLAGLEPIRQDGGARDRGAGELRRPIRAVAKLAGEAFPKTDGLDLEVVERQGGGGGTEFGVPSNVTDQDRRRVDREGRRSARPARRSRLADVRKGRGRSAPKSCARDPAAAGANTSKMVAHVVEADEAYAREMGIKLKAPIGEVRAAMLEVLREPSDGSPIADRKWTARYAAHRIAWHALDHAWEIEDRSTPAD